MMINGKEQDYVIHDEYNIKGFFGEYRFLSNFHVAPILWMGLGFTSTEAAYHASKCSNIDAAKVFQNYSPVESKKYSKLINVPKNWHDVKFNIMAQLVFQKFLIHPELRQLLLDTGDKYLEETNNWGDVYFGVCDGIGENKLGIILMATRKMLREIEILTNNQKQITGKTG